MWFIRRIIRISWTGKVLQITTDRIDVPDFSRNYNAAAAAADDDDDNYYDDDDNDDHDGDHEDNDDVDEKNDKYQ
ncbi:hypothetical protein PoB_006333700 [Plakobranchus ocellatus]|uniref:Uncharacterized protein n=1 Tax=Plakobranchus ocellatus TaxID=259542 RepID=A0AAV4CY37_9GAST|nr:hypothetical protein PoB_006333700 [Plakobranchus ocellatus]